MPTPKKHLSFAQVIALRKILLAPENKGLTLPQMQEKCVGFSKRTVKNWRTRLRQNPEFMGRFDAHFKDIVMILAVAKQKNETIHDVMDQFPDLKKDLYEINKEMTLVEIDGPFKASRQKQIEILEYARDHGVMETIRHYPDLQLYKQELIEWNNVYNIYTPKPATTEIDDGFIIHVLKCAEEYNLLTNSYGGIKAMSKKYQISPSLLYKENGRYNLVSRRSSRNQSRISEDVKQEIIKQITPTTTVADLSRQFGYGTETIKRLLTQNDYICDRSGIRPSRDKQR